jgi:hypothetical protein
MPVMGGSQNSRPYSLPSMISRFSPLLSKIYAACANRLHGRNPASRERSPMFCKGDPGTPNHRTKSRRSGSWLRRREPISGRNNHFLWNFTAAIGGSVSLVQSSNQEHGRA